MDLSIAASLKKSGVRVGKRGAQQAFAARLFDILANEPDDVISWNAAGTVFFIRDSESFSEEILTKYYRHNKLSSFQRQLNLYHFRKLSKGVDAGGYTHDCFRRDKPELLYRVRRAVAGQPMPTAASYDAEDDSSSSFSASASSSSSRGGGSKGSRRGGGSGGGGSGGSQKTRSSKKSKGNLPPVKAAVPLVLKAKQIIREASGTSRAVRSSKLELISSPSSTALPTPSSSAAASRPSSPVPTCALPRFGITLPSLHQRKAELIREQQQQEQERQGLQLRKQHQQQEIELIQRLRQHQQQQQEELERKFQQQVVASCFPATADTFTTVSPSTSTKVNSSSEAAAAAPPPLTLPESAWGEHCDGGSGSRKRARTPMTEPPTPATSMVHHEPSYVSGLVSGGDVDNDGAFSAGNDNDGDMTHLNYYYYNNSRNNLGGPQRRPSVTSSVTSSSSYASDIDLDGFDVEEYEAEQREMEGQGMVLMNVGGGGTSDQLAGRVEEAALLRDDCNNNSINNSNKHFDFSSNYNTFINRHSSNSNQEQRCSGGGSGTAAPPGNSPLATFAPSSYYSTATPATAFSTSPLTSSMLPTSRAVRSLSSSSYLSLGSLEGMQMLRQCSFDWDAAFTGEPNDEELAFEELASMLCEE